MWDQGIVLVVLVEGCLCQKAQNEAESKNFDWPPQLAKS